MRHVALLIFLITPASALADGKMYSVDRIPAIPYQRALIHFQDGRELLVVQASYAGPQEDLGWVVPCPAPPAVAALKGDDMFRSLSLATKPKVIYFSKTLLPLAFALLGVLLVTGLAMGTQEKHRRSGAVLVRISMLGLVIAVITFASSTTASKEGRGGVETISSHQVGVFDVKVIRAESAEPLIGWLAEHDFTHGPEDRKALDAYVRRGWCFATARIRKGTREIHGTETMVLPLVLYFDSPEPVFPLALTGTIGGTTRVLLYALADTGLEGSDPFKVEFACPSPTNWVEWCRPFLDPPDFFSQCSLAPRVGRLTKLSAYVPPNSMKQDLVLRQARHEDSPRTLYRW